MVKDSWRPDDRPAQCELLELVQGVVQIVSYETARRETKYTRCPSTVSQFQNRVFERAIMKAYGGPIESSTPVLSRLCAIRDAIAGT